MSLLSWQLEHYPAGHRDRNNLLLHAVTNPLFVVAWPAALAFGIARRPVPAAVCVAVALAAFAAQGRGHGAEEVAPQPITSLGNLLARFFAEQYVTFPRFVLSGGWLAAWRSAGDGDASTERRGGTAQPGG